MQGVTRLLIAEASRDANLTEVGAKKQSEQNVILRQLSLAHSESILLFRYTHFNVTTFEGAQSARLATLP